MKAYWKLLGLLLLLASAGRPARGQGAAQTCGGGRYVADVFTAVTQTSSIVFGYNSVHDYSTGTDTPVTLQLDFYEPAGDAAAQRPLLIFAFGGSFVTGQRQDLDDLCRAFALKGYATATIDYRLVPPGAGCPPGYAGCNYALVFGSQAGLADEIVRASSDMKAAVRFFRHDAAAANTYRIDPTRVIVAGYSAGAITALQTAYIDSETEDATFTTAYQNNGGLEGNTDFPAPNNLLPTYNARNLAGTFSLAGGVVTLGVVSAGNPPLYSAHGTSDAVVPYNYGPVFGVSAYSLYGSGAIQPQATAAGIANQLYPIVNGDHGSSRQEPNRTAINTAAAAFFQTLICNAPLPVVLAGFTAQAAPVACGATLSWRSASEQASLAYEVQRSADGQQFTVVGRVPSRNSPTGATYTFSTDRLAGPTYFRLHLLDTDGAASYSPVVSLPACTTVALVLTPNPVRDQLTVSGLPASSYRVEVYGATGQRVALAHGMGQLTLTLGLAGLPAGLYLVKAATEAGQPLGQGRVVKE